jgi:hypothetical protein
MENELMDRYRRKVDLLDHYASVALEWTEQLENCRTSALLIFLLWIDVYDCLPNYIES